MKQLGVSIEVDFFVTSETTPYAQLDNVGASELVHLQSLCLYRIGCQGGRDSGAPIGGQLSLHARF